MERLKTNYEKVEKYLLETKFAYEKVNEILTRQEIIKDIQSDNPKSIPLLVMIDKAYLEHLPVELLQLAFYVNFSGLGEIEARYTSFWKGGENLQGITVDEVLATLESKSDQWQKSLDDKIGDQSLDKLISNIKYYKDQMQRLIGELLVEFPSQME